MFFELLRDDSGQGLVEYALVIALVSVAAVTTMKLLGKKANNSLSNSANAMP